MDVNHVGRLQEKMIERGITPVYEEVNATGGTHINLFRTRLSCPIIREGSVQTVYGEGSSKKIAKHAAAANFMKHHLNEKNDNDCSAQLQTPQSDCLVKVSPTNRPVLLQTICRKYGLEQPKYLDVLRAGPDHAPKFTVACEVGSVRTEGERSRKCDAKLAATTKMIQSLMKDPEIYEIFEDTSPKTLSKKSNAIICFIDSSNGSPLPNPVNIFGRRRSLEIIVEKQSVGDIGNGLSCSGSDSPPDMPKTIGCQSISTPIEINRSVRSVDTSRSDYILTELLDNFRSNQLLLIQMKGKSLNDLSKSGGSNDSTISSDNASRNISRLQTINKIDRALENAENQLYNEILDTLEQRDKKIEKKVIILSNEFDVFINHDRRVKVSDGTVECTDESIRIACLTKLLLDLKEHIKNKC